MTDEVAIVTGAGSADGIGFAIARALLAGAGRGAITSTTSRLHERAAELGEGAAAYVADLTLGVSPVRLAAWGGGPAPAPTAPPRRRRDGRPGGRRRRSSPPRTRIANRRAAGPMRREPAPGRSGSSPPRRKRAPSDPGGRPARRRRGPT